MAANCANYLLNNTNISFLKHTCEFHRTPKPDHLIVTQITIIHFLWQIISKCWKIFCNNTTTSAKVPTIDFGIVEIELPCIYKLLSREETLIYSIYPCDSRDFAAPSIHHLIPLTWTNLDYLKSDLFDVVQRTGINEN